MFPLSKDIDLSFFRNKLLLQVCVGKNEVILNFDGDVKLTILSTFRVSSDASGEVEYDESAAGGARLLSLLHDTARLATPTADGGLQLAFESGTVLVLLDTSKQYESFWIEAPPSIRIIV
jgi:hypothetical protein